MALPSDGSYIPADLRLNEYEVRTFRVCQDLMGIDVPASACVLGSVEKKYIQKL